VYISREFDLTCEGDDEIEFCQFFDLDALPERISPGSENRIREYLSGEIGAFGRW
jgi:hypothetical protein